MTGFDMMKEAIIIPIFTFIHHHRIVPVNCVKGGARLCFMSTLLDVIYSDWFRQSNGWKQKANIPPRHREKKSNNKTGHKICIKKRKQKQSKESEAFINIKREHDCMTACDSDRAASLSLSPLAVYTPLSPLHITQRQIASHIITQTYFILTNASVHTLSCRGSNSAPVHIFRCVRL